MFKKTLLIAAVSLFIFGVSKLSFAMMCGEHSEQKQMAQAHTGHEQGATETPKQTAEKVVNVGNKICPVSGEKIDEKMKQTYEYEGKIYNFCCADCINEFKKDPQKYIKKVEEELQTESKGQSEHKEHDMGMMQGTGASDEGMHGGHHH